ncbi:hypothetical protein [Exiguobacterium artemiae]|nr:hypothetical protein [Exiguobacterium sibiricum]MDW2886682.1 hypothetical protein [Exiguobacterium sibiricum]
MKRIIRMINLFEYDELPSHVRPVALQHLYEQNASSSTATT